MDAEEGGLKTRFPFAEASGRRGGFATAGIGAWLIMGAALSKSKSSLNIWKGSCEPATLVGLAIAASVQGRMMSGQAAVAG
jgi:hypothetical protein